MRSLIWIFVVLVVASATASTKLWRDLRAERELSTSLQGRLDEAAQAPATAAAPAASALPSASTAPVAPSTVAANQTAVTPVPAAAEKPRTTPVPSALEDYQKQEREMMKDPEYRKARLAQIRASIARNNPGLAEELGISQQDADKVLDLMAEHDLAMTNDMRLLGDSNDTAAVQEMLRKQQEYMRQRDEKVAAMLGPGRAAQWQQYQEAAPARSRVNGFNSMLTRSNQPLSAIQQRNLVAALAPEMHALNEEMNAMARGMNPKDPGAVARLQDSANKRQEEAEQRILVAAAPILTSAQLAIVRAQIEQQRAMSRAFSRAQERATANQMQEAP